jgi:hypothetical protein
MGHKNADVLKSYDTRLRPSLLPVEQYLEKKTHRTFILILKLIRLETSVTSGRRFSRSVIFNLGYVYPQR